MYRSFQGTTFLTGKQDLFKSLLTSSSLTGVLPIERDCLFRKNLASTRRKRMLLSSVRNATRERREQLAGGGVKHGAQIESKRTGGVAKTRMDALFRLPGSFLSDSGVAMLPPLVVLPSLSGKLGGETVSFRKMDPFQAAKLPCIRDLRVFWTRPATHSTTAYS